MGLEWAGMRVAWQCELDSWKRQVLAAHWPGVPIYDDITTMTTPPAVDVLVGGFPCQDLSVAGKRKGFHGQRSILAFEFLRLAETIKPKWIILENVPGLLSSSRGEDFARLIDEVVSCGYGVAWRILDARSFGVPQRRRRVFIVAHRTNPLLDTRGASRLALRSLLESSDRDSTPSWPPRTLTAPSVGCGTPSSGGVGDVSATVTKKWAKGSGGPSGDECQNLVAFGHTQGIDIQPSEKHTPTLRVGGGGGAVAFRKGRRAQTDQDDETRVDDGGANTLNAFDAGDVRTTHAIVDVASTLQAAGGERGNRLDAEGAAGGHLIASTLTSGGHPNSNAPGRRREDDDNIVTFTSRGREGGAQTEAQTDGVHPAPRAGRGSSRNDSRIAFPIDDGRPLEKNQNGTGIGDAGAPAYTLDRQQHASVAVPAQMSVRRLTPIECERLMGWPATEKTVRIVVWDSSENQRSDALVDNPSPRLPVSVWAADGEGSWRSVASAEQSSGTHPLGLEVPVVVNVHIDSVREVVEILNGRGELIAPVAGAGALMPSGHRVLPGKDIAQLFALMLPTLEKVIPSGRAAQQPHNALSGVLKSGEWLVHSSGDEIEALVNDATLITSTVSALLRPITLPVSPSSQNSDSTLRTLCCCVAAVISGYIPEGTPIGSSYALEITWTSGWTAPEGVKAPDSKRYAACGDGIVSWCAYWIGGRIQMIEAEETR